MTGISTIGQTAGQISRLKELQTQFQTLNFQLSTQRKTDRFSGLGADVLADKRSRANIKVLEVYNTNISKAQSRIDLTLNAIKEFKEQARTVYSALIALSQESSQQEGETIRYDDPLTPDVNEGTFVGQTSGTPTFEFAAIQNLAGDVYDILYDLLNQQEGERYLLGGADTSTQPINDTGALSTAITSMINNWKGGTISTQQVIADLQNRDPVASGNPDCINDTIVGFSAALTAGNVGSVFVRADNRTEINYTTLANGQGFRDIMVAISYLKSDNLGPVVDVYAEPYTPGDPVLNDPVTGRPLQGAPGATTEEMRQNFFEVINALIKTVHSALGDIDRTVNALEGKKARLNLIQQQNTFEKHSLNNLVSDIEGVDLNEVAVKITALQTSLEASYSVTSRVLQMSLVNFIN